MTDIHSKTCDIFISPTIREFYEKNPDQDAIQNHLQILHIISAILENQATTLTTSQIKQINDNLLKMQHSIDRVETKVETTLLKRENDDLNQRERIISEVRTILKSHLHETADHIRHIIERNTDTTFEKTKNVIFESSSTTADRFEDKLSLLLRDNFAKTEDEFRKLLPAERATITETFATMYQSINDIFKTSAEEKQKTDLEIRQELVALGKQLEKEGDIFSTFDAKFAQFTQNAHVTISQTMAASEERLTSQLHGINDVAMRTEQTQIKMSDKQEEHLSKYRSSSLKGQMSERHLLSVLTDMFPSAEIRDTSHDTSSGDFIIKRCPKGIKPDILVENKDYKANVRLEEVDKFINDCRVQKKHGIILSQSSGICNKSSYETEIIDDKYIAVFVHTVDYQPHVIGSAVSILDSIHSFLFRKRQMSEKHGVPRKKRSRTSVRGDDGFDEDDDDNDDFDEDASFDNDGSSTSENEKADNGNLVITAEMIAAINEEIQNIIRNKEDMLLTMATFNKVMTTKINEINFQSLDSIMRREILLVCSNCKTFQCMSAVQMRTHKDPGGGCLASQKYECELCQNFTASNKHGLINHKRSCAKKIAGGPNSEPLELTCDLCYVYKAQKKSTMTSHKKCCAKKLQDEA